MKHNIFSTQTKTSVKTGKILAIILLVGSLVILIAGLTSTPCLGDEISHYRFAKSCFTEHMRATCDPLYSPTDRLGYIYNSPPLWHILLACFWAVSGGISVWVTQIYQTIYFAFLILTTYLIAKELYGEQEGLYAALITTTLPIVTAFSILFYLDIPGTCLGMLCLWSILKRHHIIAGITLGLMYVTKQNACFLMAFPMLWVLCQANTKWLVKIRNLFYFIAPFFITLIADMRWREAHLKSIQPAIPSTVTTNTIMLPGSFQNTLDRVVRLHWDSKTTEYLNSSLLNPVDIAKYAGLILLAGLLFYFILRKYEKKDFFLWGCIGCYFLIFCYIFHPGSDIRYLLPIMPLLAILAAKGLKWFWDGRPKWLVGALLLLCIIQFAGTAYHVNQQRQIPKEIQEGFTYLKNNTPPDSLVLYPEYVILEGAQRPFAWGFLRKMLQEVFWSDADAANVKALLSSNHVRFIAIKKNRIYDDTSLHHFGGYPQSFVKRIPKYPCLKLVFDNDQIGIWEVQGATIECTVPPDSINTRSKGSS